jgi:hypothetical protein
MGPVDDDDAVGRQQHVVGAQVEVDQRLTGDRAGRIRLEGRERGEVAGGPGIEPCRRVRAQPVPAADVGGDDLGGRARRDRRRREDRRELRERLEHAGHLGVAPGLRRVDALDVLEREDDPAAVEGPQQARHRRGHRQRRDDRCLAAVVRR